MGGVGWAKGRGRLKGFECWPAVVLVVRLATGSSGSSDCGAVSGLSGVC